MNDALRSSLRDIDEALRRLGSPLVNTLRPGIPAGTITERLNAIGFASDADLETLFGWHDGTSFDGGTTIGDAYLLPGFFLTPLDDAIHTHLALRSSKRWAKGWLPFMEDGGGDYFVVELAKRGWRAAKTAQRGRVRHFRNEEPEHHVEYRSIGAMFATVAAAYDQGVFLMDADGCLDMDYERYGQLAAALNPDVRAWTE